MNKEEILEAFFKDRPIHPKIPDCVTQFEAVFTSDRQEPCALNSKLSEPDDENRLSEHSNDAKNKPIEVEKSLKSAFSEIAIDKNMYTDILNNRKRHNIFLEFEEGPIDEKSWYFKDETNRVSGPLSARQMNDLYQLGKFTEDYSFGKDPEGRFTSFQRMIKKYYIKRLPKSEVCPAKTAPKQPQLSSFAKLDLKFSNPTCITTAEERPGRQTRLLSHEVKPNLSFLENVIEDFDMNEVIQTRGRSSTVDQ